MGSTTESPKDAVKWYDKSRGETVVGVLVLATLLTVGLSLGTDIDPETLPPLYVSVPVDIYIYGFLGSTTRTITSFVADFTPIGRDGDDGNGEEETVWKVSSRDIKQAGVRTFAALSLAAGVYLSVGLLAESISFVSSPSTTVVSGGAFIVGFYVKRAYDAIGGVADRILERVEDDSAAEERETWRSADTVTFFKSTADEAGNSRSERFWTAVVVLLGTGVTLLAVVLSIDWGEASPFWLAWVERYLPTEASVPLDVYLYALLGSLGYVFTSLFEEFDRNLESLFRHALRVPAGPLLAAGLFLVTGLILPPAGSEVGSTDLIVAGLAYILGLYTNVALLILERVSDRFFGAFGRRRQSTDEGEN